MKMISSEDKEEWLKETYEHLQKLKEDKYGDVELDYIMLYELHEEEHKEIERLKTGYCELKVKCNNGECDCTNEEYDGMVESNIKLSLEVDRLNNIIDEKSKIVYELRTYIEHNLFKYFDDEKKYKKCRNELYKIIFKELKEGK